MTPPEFSRPQRLDRIGAGALDIAIAAEPSERTALAQRFGLIAIDRLEARFKMHREGAAVLATGHLHARITQACIASDEPVPAAIDEDFRLRFLSEAAGDAGPGDEIELSEGECDTVFYSGGAIDLGEAAAETLALSLDPFPRSPRAAEVLRAAGVLSEEQAGPLGALASLKATFEAKKD